jgi:hypothetical protein
MFMLLGLLMKRTRGVVVLPPLNGAPARSPLVIGQQLSGCKRF